MTRKLLLSFLLIASIGGVAYADVCPKPSTFKVVENPYGTGYDVSSGSFYGYIATGGTDPSSINKMVLRGVEYQAYTQKNGMIKCDYVTKLPSGSYKVLGTFDMQSVMVYHAPQANAFWKAVGWDAQCLPRGGYANCSFSHVMK